MCGGDYIVEALEPGGRRVRLEENAVQHILANHRELEPHIHEIIAIVVQPDHHEFDPIGGRERYYGRGIGPSDWLVVVVDFGTEPARVVTAYGTRKGPRDR